MAVFNTCLPLKVWSAMSDPTVRGIVHLVEPTKTYGQKGFRKRLVVLEQDKGRFTNFVPLEFVQDACDSVDRLSVGDDVEVTYRLSGRKWQRDENSEVKFFLNAEALGFTVLPSASGGGSSPDQKSANDALNEAAYDDEDVPF